MLSIAGHTYMHHLSIVTPQLPTYKTALVAHIMVHTLTDMRCMQALTVRLARCLSQQAARTG